MSADICREVYRGPALSLQVLDRASACFVTHDEPYAVISITDPQNRHPHLTPCPLLQAVLRLQFSDVGERFARLSVSSPNVVAIDLGLARQIATFVREQYNSEVRLLVIHCEAGVSRSAGVASAISRFYNGEDSFFQGQYHPNPWVQQLVFDALQEISQETSPGS